MYTKAPVSGPICLPSCPPPPRLPLLQFPNHLEPRELHYTFHYVLIVEAARTLQAKAMCRTKQHETKGNFSHAACELSLES